MPRLLFAACALLTVLAPAVVAQGAPSLDREVTWRSYAADRHARVRVFQADDDRRPVTIVVDDRAENGGPVTDDATYLADHLARELSLDPTTATFVFRFTPAAFAEGASDRGKTLLLRATFRRTTSGALGAPSWRVIDSHALSDLTDRATL